MTSKKRQKYAKQFNHDYDHDGRRDVEIRTKVVKTVSHYRELICSECLPKQRAAEAKNRTIMCIIFGVVLLVFLIAFGVIFGVLYSRYQAGKSAYDYVESYSNKNLASFNTPPITPSSTPTRPTTTPTTRPSTTFGGRN